MRLTFLGTGTSFGVPVIGCACAACTSPDPRDRRTRHGALLEWGSDRLLIDTPPELRLQLLAQRVDDIDAVWFTHAHADHVHGIDDLRVFSFRGGRDVPAYVPEGTSDYFHARFPYIFDPGVQVAEGTSKPHVRLIEVSPVRPIEVLGRPVWPLPVPHGALTVYGLRVGGLGYITDGKRLSPEVERALEGVRVLVLNALWFGRPHPTHFNVEEAVAAAERIGAERTYLTHLTHRVTHQELEAKLPTGVLPAYDGLTVEIPE
ncbi:MAG: MBL fold metallo-hydrolase [Gemmatimonadota bacterium]